MDRIEKLEEEIQLIKKRNALVELDKQWALRGWNSQIILNENSDPSWTRRGLIALFTYLAISLYMLAINIDRPFLNAIVPTVGFMLSTLTLPWFKKMWIENK